MEKEMYSEDEKELCELIEFVIAHYEKYPYKNDVEKKHVKDLIVVFKDMESKIKNFGKVRYEREIEKDNLEKNRMFASYNAICEHCMVVSELVPLREEEGKMDIKYYVYFCPECKQEFNGQPNTDEAMIRWNDHLIKMMTEIMPDGGTLAHKAKIPIQDINNMRKSGEAFKEACRVEQEEIEVQRKNNENQARLVKESVASFTLQKLAIINGNKVVGES